MTAEPEITVSNVEMGDQDLAFDVSKVGTPVLVKMSYFPNWQVDGADGPYRVAPNFMVVVPTSTHVRLHYDTSSLEQLAWLVTLMGIGLLFFWRFRVGDVRHRTAHPFDRDWDTDAPMAAAFPPPGAYDPTLVDRTLDPLLIPPELGDLSLPLAREPHEGSEDPSGSL